MSLFNHSHSICSRHAFLVEAEAVQGLAVGHFVGAEPLADGADEAGQQLLHVCYVVEQGSPWVSDTDSNELPVRFALIDKTHGAQDLHGSDLADTENA